MHNGTKIFSFFLLMGLCLGLNSKLPTYPIIIKTGIKPTVVLFYILVKTKKNDNFPSSNARLHVIPCSVFNLKPFGHPGNEKVLWDIGCWGKWVGGGLKNNSSLIYQILDMMLKLVALFSSMISNLMISIVHVWIICFWERVWWKA